MLSLVNDTTKELGTVEKVENSNSFNVLNLKQWGNTISKRAVLLFVHLWFSKIFSFHDYFNFRNNTDPSEKLLLHFAQKFTLYMAGKP